MISYRKLAMRVLGHSPVSAARTARRSTAKRAAALALTAALVVGMTLPAFAQDWYIEDGDISISAGETGNKVTQGSTTKENDTDTVIKSKDSSTASSNTVTIHADEGKTVNVTLDNVTINVDEGYKYGYEPNAYKTAVSVTGSGNTNIELNGNNTLTSGYGHAGLEHNKTDGSGTLTIQDEKNDDGSAKGSASDTTGSLTANGGGRGAGIGGSDEHDGQVTITGGEITATGGNGAAGIGGGAGDKYAAVGGDGDVTISGGTITATGGSLAAGIGGGLDGNGTVIITDGDITAKATGRYGAGIGGGCGEIPKGTLIGGNGTVTISGGTITEASGGYMAAGIGSGLQGLGTVTIEGDAVIKNAQGGEAGAGIGSGTRGNSEIIIRGDAVIENAESKENGAGIGSGQGDLYPDGDGMVIDLTVGNVTIEGNAKIENAKSGSGGSGIGGGVIGIGNVIIRGNAQIGNATGGEEGAGIGGGALGTGDVTIEGNVTIENAQGGAGAAGIGGGAETQPDTEDTRNKVSIKSTEAGSPNITAKGGGVLNNEEAPLPGAAAIGSGSVADGATEVKSDITVEGKVTIDATSGGNVAIGDSINGETRFSGLQVGTTITRRNAKGDDVSQPGDVVREPEKPAQPTVTPTEGAEAPSTGSVEVERPVTVEGLYVTNVLGKQITHTCTQNGTTLTIRANGIVASAHLTLGMVRTLKAQGVKTLVFTTLLSRSTTVSVDALLAAEPDAPDEMAVVWTHTGPRAALTIGGADHSALLK
ncbi:hypothetical protein [Faecalibacterium prausnitzii]|mgnify:CR=1 FL=1|uniref:Carbohydrate-binding domain-containing protein n=1 Tax=Faecalibacterium prausnitzii TaxID=853 RepID=A0A3E2V9F8_9FIRM|nr:hypothetical protein [Faecalibacterium prausnitzii]RGC07070.1 hypothetical protein DW905_00315 [Faecalibacterium prausnitzii]